MRSDREKLIELLNDIQTEGNKSSYVEWAGCKMKHEVKNEHIADHLIANGVTFATDNNVGDKMTPTDKDTNVLTNADRIRAMSDEELAEFANKPRFGWGCHLCVRVTDWCDDDCKKHILKWLKQPAEVEHG